MIREKREGRVLFNDILNIFYLRLYGVRHMVKDHSDSEKGNPLPPHGLLFSINSKVSLKHFLPSTLGTMNTSDTNPHQRATGFSLT